MKQVTAVLGAVREKEQCKVHRWEEQEHRQARPDSCSEKTVITRSFAKQRQVRERQALTNADVRPPCDNLQNNPCHFHVIWVRIPPKGLLQMQTLVLPHLSLFTFKAGLSDCLCSKMLAGCWLCVIYLLWFGVRTLWKSALQGLCHVC